MEEERKKGEGEYVRPHESGSKQFWSTTKREELIDR